MWDITMLLAESWDNHTMVFDSFLCYFRLFDNLLKSSLNCKYIQHDASLFFRSKWYAIVWPESGIIKGTVRHQVKNIYFPLSCSAGYLSRLLWCDLQSFRDIVCRDVCLLWNVMELDRLVVLKVPKNTVKKNLKQQCLFPEFSTCLPKIIHRLCNEQFLYSYSKTSG